MGRGGTGRDGTRWNGARWNGMGRGGTGAVRLIGSMSKVKRVFSYGSFGTRELDTQARNNK